MMSPVNYYQKIKFSLTIKKSIHAFRKPAFSSRESAAIIMMLPKELSTKPYVKFCVFVLLILTPLAVLFIIFTPLAAKKTKTIMYNQYSLPKDFTRDDVLRVIGNMRGDPEFQYYFLHLKENDVESAVLEVLIILDKAKTESLLLEQIDKNKEAVRSLALLFYNLELNDDFYVHTEQYEEINRIIWKFLYDDFKLNILGICYKASYDEEFSFRWDRVTRLSAQKLNSVLTSLYNRKS